MKELIPHPHSCQCTYCKLIHSREAAIEAAPPKARKGPGPMALVTRERKSPFIQPFKPPQGHGICPGFHKLTPGIGCPYRCSYCFLNTTLRSMQPGGGPRRWEAYTNVGDMITQLDAFIMPYDGLKGPYPVISAGETCDSLATPEIKLSLKFAIEAMRGWANEFKWASEEIGEEFYGPTLLLLTKSDKFPDCQPSPNVILSWSINSPRMANVEKGAPPPMHRFLAAMNAKKLGWRIRVRIDPIIETVDPTEPVPRTMPIMEIYEKIFLWMGLLQPERITLGTLRRSGKPVLPTGRRVAIYRDFIFRLNTQMGLPVGLCKETPEVYKALGMDTKDIKCNCTN